MVLAFTTNTRISTTRKYFPTNFMNEKKKKKIPKIERMNRDWRVKRIVVNQCLMNGIEKTGR